MVAGHPKGVITSGARPALRSASDVGDLLSPPLPLTWRIRAAATAAIVPPLLEVMSLARIERVLGAFARLRVTRVPDDAGAARWIDETLACLPSPWSPTCLRRSTVLLALLRPAGRDVELRIGVRRDTHGKLRAHAWLARDGQPYLETKPEHVAAFTEIARFTGARPASPRARHRDGARLLIDTLRLVPSDADELAARWASADQATLVRAADFEGAALWLQRRLIELGITLVGRAHELLRRASLRDAAQAARVDAELWHVLEILDANGLDAIPLKSSSVRRLAHRIPYADARAPMDVDLLVRAGDAFRAWEALESIGYDAPLSAPSDRQHLPALVGPNGVSVELHVTSAVGISREEAWRRATRDDARGNFNGVERRMPSDTELLWHAVADGVKHVEVSGRSGLRLRYLLDAAALIAAGRTIDWARLGERFGEAGRADLYRAWLGAARELSGKSVPWRQRVDLERLLAWRLRVLSRGEVTRWPTRLLEEAGRGEAHLPIEPANPRATPYARTRHWVAARAARVWWVVTR